MQKNGKLENLFLNEQRVDRSAQEVYEQHLWLLTTGDDKW